MFGIVEYAQPLRAIGQALELLRVESFDLETDGNDLLVRGNAVVAAAAGDEGVIEDNKIREIWGFLPGQRSLDSAVSLRAKAVTLTQVDLRYTPRDIDRLEQQGQTKRQNPRGMADSTRLSQLLRTVGGYVTQKHGRLMKISRSGDSLQVSYENSEGRRYDEALTASELYDFWVRMYMKRSERN